MTLVGNGKGSHHHQMAQQLNGLGQQGANFIATHPLTNNDVGSDDKSTAIASGGDDDDDEDDQDSEALLYKMMQQQNFLVNPVWQEQFSGSGIQNGRQQQQQNRPFESVNQGNSDDNRDNRQQRQHQEELANSKRVIKLLKSYSHIHQVDDSDDQIRGTYKRLSSYRPSKVANGSQDGGGKNRYSNQNGR